MIDKSALRDAATVILLRELGDGERAVLMGQRGRGAAFMPGKFVFPGGAVDSADADVPLANPAPQPCMDRLVQDSPNRPPQALLAAAIREVWEETGLRLSAPGPWPGEVPEDWQSFAAPGALPDASGLRFFFRAVTPPGRPRRFDARFFLGPASAVAGDLDDFSQADDELSHLQWVPLGAARDFDLPFITKVVLAELAQLPKVAPPAGGVPFVMNDDLRNGVTRIV